MKYTRLVLLAAALAFTSCSHFGGGKGCCKKDKAQCSRSGKKCDKSKKCDKTKKKQCKKHSKKSSK